MNNQEILTKAIEKATQNGSLYQMILYSNTKEIPVSGDVPELITNLELMQRIEGLEIEIDEIRSFLNL